MYCLLLLLICFVFIRPSWMQQCPPWKKSRKNYKRWRTKLKLYRSNLSPVWLRKRCWVRENERDEKTDSFHDCIIIEFIEMYHKSRFSTIGPNGSKNCQVRFQLYFHMSQVRRGTITNRSRPGILGKVRQPCWAVMVECMCETSPLYCLGTSFSIAG